MCMLNSSTTAIRISSPTAMPKILTPIVTRMTDPKRNSRPIHCPGRTNKAGLYPCDVNSKKPPQAHALSEARPVADASGSVRALLGSLAAGVLNRATKKGWIRRREGCSEDQLPWETGFPPFYLLTRPSREAWYPLHNGGA